MKLKILVEIRGGTFVGLYTNDPDAQAYVLDWDDVEAGGPPHSLRVEPSPLHDMPPETRKILDQTLQAAEGPTA